MRVFLDFEASSLGKTSYPIEVAWIFEDGTAESHLISPAPQWDDWDPAAEAIHRITPARLAQEGEDHERVAARMIACLAGHRLYASAPSWDGKWLSALLRAAGLPRHSLRLADTEEAQRETAAEVLRPVIAADRLDAVIADIMVRARIADRQPPEHRALADAEQELRRCRKVRALAETVRDAACQRAGAAAPAP